MIELNQNNFDDIIKSGINVVEFGAPWCVPCCMLLSTLEDLNNQLSDVIFTKVSVDVNPDLALRFNVMSVPTLLFIKDGLVVSQINGMTNKKDIMTALNLLIDSKTK